MSSRFLKLKRNTAAGRLLLFVVLCSAVVPLSCSAEEELLQCASKLKDSERLKCYDDLAAARMRENKAMESVSVQPPEDVAAAAEPPKSSEHDDTTGRSFFTRVWNLDGRGSGDDSARLTPLQPHRQNYLIVRETNQPNRLPYTPAVNAHSPALPYDLDPLETKFQLSFKAEIMHYREIHWLDFKDFRLWGAYTMQSSWQSFNTRNSSPFRETNYEPEFIATFGTGNTDGFKLVNLGLVHQSNGRGGAESRSWHRVYLQGGWEWDSIALLARGWWRIPEDQLKDDNPDITDYLGHADAVIHWEPDNTQSVSLLVRNNLSLGSNRGFMQLDWNTPVFIGKSAKLHAQLTSGYGESLIDYNHSQRTFGLGISFREW